MAAAQGAGVKPTDLPDLTIKDVHVYDHIDTGRGATQIAGIVTNSGIEGNYSLAARYWHLQNLDYVCYDYPIPTGDTTPSTSAGEPWTWSALSWTSWAASPAA